MTIICIKAPKMTRTILKKIFIKRQMKQAQEK